FFVNFFRLALTVLRFGRRIAAVCTTLAWCAAEVVSSSLTGGVIRKDSVDDLSTLSFLLSYLCLVLREDGSGAE
ncbi:hypothetical protein, partial [Fumia xinanensis]|uniref:hypothetical protein n=1 Tax=Fumia xinanensis TaxID=2763659 RepID=UPI0020169E51